MNSPAKPQNVKEFKEVRFDIYKPSKKIEMGSAAQFVFSPENKCIFLSLAKQEGEKLAPGATGKQFDWEKSKIVVKLDEMDIGRFLAVITSRLKDTNFMHSSGENKSRVTGIKFQRQTGEYDNFMLDVMQKEGEAKKGVRLYIDHHEAAVLHEFLKTSVLKICGF